MYKFAFLIGLLCLALHASAQNINTTDKSQNVGKVEWLEQHFDTDKVPFNVPVVREYQAKNVSSENLVIQKINTGCHCTVAEWPQQPVAPGDTVTIKVTFDAQMEGPFYKIMMVYTNFAPDQAVLFALTGKVDKKPMAAAAVATEKH